MGVHSVRSEILTFFLKGTQNEKKKNVSNVGFGFGPDG
jgi:hypothetical protein